MSQVRVDTIVDANSGNTAQINGMTPTADSLQGFRNRIINGDMRIDQRNAGASVTPANGGADYIYTLDRWRVFSQANSKFSIQQNAGAVTPPAGFNNYLGVTSLAATSVGASDLYLLGQRIEGFNFADFGWGTANAQTITLSFWVRSSLTGTFGGALQNSAVNRSYPFAYTISAANTWEQKTITIAGDTTGTWVGSTNGAGCTLQIGLGVGSSFSGTAGAWAGSGLFSATGAVSVVATSGATFYITGVQLEAGSVATPFERRPYGTELALCQRYFEKSFDQGAAPAQNTGSLNGALVTSGSSAEPNVLLGHTAFAAEKRAQPSVITFNPFSAGTGWSQSGAGNLTASAYVLGTRAIAFRVDGTPGINTNLSIHWTASAEL
jgi:hypothetical protein